MFIFALCFENELAYLDPHNCRHALMTKRVHVYIHSADFVTSLKDYF